VSKKDLERWQQLIANQKSHAHAASQTRQERIKVLWDAIASGELTRGAKDLAENELVRSLVELADLQKREIEYLKEFRRDWEQLRTHYPEDLENLRSQSLSAELQPLEDELLARWETPKQEYELKRRRRRNLIEDEFGRAREPWLRTDPTGPLPLLLPSLVPTCLDGIFEGGRVKMIRLQELFGMHRNRFPKELPKFEKGRETVYDYLAVMKIMRSLLGEKPPKRKRPTRGRERRVWLSKPDLRRRVLSGIETRVSSLKYPEQIKREFRAVVRRYLTDSAKK
jgi:hypothetical protein